MLERVVTLLHKLEAALGQALIRAKVGLPLNKVGLDLGRSLNCPTMNLGRPINNVGWDLGSRGCRSVWQREAQSVRRA